MHLLHVSFNQDHDSREVAGCLQMDVRLPDWLIGVIDPLTRCVYIWTDGRIGSTQMGWTMLLLTTTGRRTGQQYTHTLAYLQDGAQLVIVGSNNGSDHHPAWYLNVCANPQVYVRYGRKKGDFLARTASPQERAALWPRLVAYHPPYAGHQAHTRRELPVIILSPLADQPSDTATAAAASGTPAGVPVEAGGDAPG